MFVLACYFLLIIDPHLPSEFYSGRVIRDDYGGFLIVSEISGWLGIGRIMPGGRAMHVIWTPDLPGDHRNFRPAYYSWDTVRRQWRGYVGPAHDPYTQEDLLEERPKEQL